MAVEKLTITPEGGSPVALQFNPGEYSIESSSTFAEIAIPGLEAPILQFVHGNTEALTFDCLVDSTDQPPGSAGRDAGKKADEILKLSRIDGHLHAPPICRVSWGGVSMRGVIRSVRRQFVLFDASGVPTRVRLSITINRYRSLEEQVSELNLRSADRTSTVAVRARDTLPAIAARVYGDDAAWRPIARRNRLADPARLEPGRVLEIPRLDPSGAEER